jgi:CRP-like cAMP-binding protein
MSSHQAVLDLLGQAKLFAGLPKGDLEQVARQMRPVSFEPGQLIFSRGDPGAEVYLVVDGRVRLSVLSGEGRELSFNHAGPGTVFGEIAALDGGRRTADATAVTKIRAMTLSKSAMLSLIGSSPALALATIEMLCARLRDADLQLEAVALHSIEVRLARFLANQIASQQPASTKAPAGRMPERAVLKLEMSQSELALLLGASRPKVNAAIAMLEAEGIIERSDGAVSCDVAELRRVAELE